MMTMDLTGDNDGDGDCGGCYGDNDYDGGDDSDDGNGDDCYHLACPYWIPPTLAKQTPSSALREVN
jgi:hypothetical protein